MNTNNDQLLCIQNTFLLPLESLEVLTGIVPPPLGFKCFQRAMTFIAVLLALQLGFALGEAAETLTVQLAGPAYPEVLTINQGDTVTFACLLSASTESYTGEWQSPVLQPGQTFSYTFTNAGTYVYREGTPGQGYFPGVIKVQPVIGAYPAIWITTPLDNFIVPGYTDIEAETTNSPQSVKVVNFYANGQFVGSITNPPYAVTVALGGTYELKASVVDSAGITNTSTPIRITFDSEQLFGLWRLPQGQTAFFISAAGGPYCVLWSEDLQAWNYQVPGQVLGKTVGVDESTTNVVQRFYKLKQCL